MDVFKVGGCIRDKLLGIPSNDSDWVVVDSNVKEMKRKGFKQVGKSFPVFICPYSGEEFALVRTETKVSAGHKGFSFKIDKVTLIDDLKRRDITINAIAMDKYGGYIDPCGGMDDLKNRKIRHISGSFNKDPLRVLRVARFYAKLYHLGFYIDIGTFGAAKAVSRKELHSISGDQLWIEMRKALKTKNPEKYFQALHSFGVLSEVYTEIYRMYGQTQDSRFHSEGDAFNHSMLALSEITKHTTDTRVRFAMLFHDIGKCATLKGNLPRHHGHDKIGADIIKNMCKRLNIPNEYKNLALISCRFHMKAWKSLEMKPGKVLKFLKETCAIRKPERFKNFLAVCVADREGWILKDEHYSRCAPYPELDFLLDCSRLLPLVDIKKIKSLGYPNNRLIQEIHNTYLSKIKEIRATYYKIKNNINTENTDIPVCPDCGHTDDDYPNAERAEDADGECLNCGKTYECIWDIRYTTKKT